MTDHDRGAYTPQTDAPLAFDARRSRGAGGGPAPLTLVVSAVVLLLLVIALLLFYRSGVRGAGQPPQVVGAPVGQTKAAAASDAPGPSANPALQIYKSEATPSSEPKAPTFAPAPEEPAPRRIPTVPVQTAPAPPAHGTSAPLRPAQTEPGPAAAPAVRPPVASGARLAPAIPAPKQAKSAKPIPRPAVVTTTVAGEPLVQIGAFSSAGLAQKGWSDTAALLPGRMAGRTQKVEKAERDGKTFYRSFVGGFATRAEAASFCAALKSAGKTCLVH